MIFVFEVHIRPGYSADRYGAAWLEASEIIQRAEGARGTRLHRAIGDPMKLLAIASWESKDARDAADRARDPRVQAIIQAEARHVDIRLVGEFEDADWIVDPQD